MEIVSSVKEIKLTPLVGDAAEWKNAADDVNSRKSIHNKTMTSLVNMTN